MGKLPGERVSDRSEPRTYVPMLDFCQPIAAIATTPAAVNILRPFCQLSNADLWVPQTLATEEGVNLYRGALASHLGEIWQDYRAFVFGLATGATVRLIAPLLRDKATDPAIAVVAETGEFAISLCGGHQGGADRLVQAIATAIGATPVLTGASARANLPAIDLLGIPFGWRRGEGNWTGVSAAIARGETIEILQESGTSLWQENLPGTHPFVFGFSESEGQKLAAPKARVWISIAQRRFSPDSDMPKVQWHPRVLWVGIGCERGTPQALLDTALVQTCQRYHLSPEAIAGVASLDLKADETGLLELCRGRDLPLRTFSAEELNAIAVPNPSEIVAAEVGTPSVAEAAALRAATVVGENEPNLLVSKQIFKDETLPGAVTIAIAQSPREYTGRTGMLYLVGTGPGSLAQMTPAAKTAIASADVVIGYSLYLDLISPLRRPGQIIEAYPITAERERSRRAIALANWGLTVAVVSSGDCGIFGMAGLVLEDLAQAGWDGKTPQVEVLAGITAMQAAAARVGAPLMHDFCAISLSDLLTPWEVILQRLEAAAKADFVTALYNPKSRTRTQHLATAREIFLRHRSPQTPVAIARSVYRQEEQVTLSTLEEMLAIPVDMLATVIIGNSSTRQHANWLLTPRGYFSRESAIAPGNVGVS